MYQVVEVWNHFAKKRYDLYGFIDILAVIDDTFVGIQACAGSSVSARCKKIIHDRTENARRFLQAGGLIQVWGWRKLKTKDERGRYWQVRIIHITLEDLDD